MYRDARHTFWKSVTGSCNGKWGSNPVSRHSLSYLKYASACRGYNPLPLYAPAAVDGLSLTCFRNRKLTV